MAYLIKVKLNNGNEVVACKDDIDDCFKWYVDAVQGEYERRVKKITVKFVLDAPKFAMPNDYKFGD